MNSFEPVAAVGVGPTPAGEGEVKPTMGSWSERMISHTGTETRSRLLREAAVGNIAQWRKL